MTHVWEAFPASGSELLCMLAMADWCNDQGESLHPSMRSIAKKIRVSEKQARRIVHGLEQEGYLSVIGNAHGGKPGDTKQWRIDVARLKKMATDAETAPTDVTPPADVTPPTGVPRPLPPVSKTPPTGGSQTTIEPPVEPSEDKARAALHRPESVEPQTWSDFLRHRNAKRAPLTATALRGIEREAAKAGVTLDDALAMCCERGWTGFRAAWMQEERSTKAAAPAESFRERDQRLARERWEQATGQRHPDNASADHRVIDITPGLIDRTFPPAIPF